MMKLCQAVTLAKEVERSVMNRFCFAVESKRHCQNIIPLNGVLIHFIDYLKKFPVFLNYYFTSPLTGPEKGRYGAEKCSGKCASRTEYPDFCAEPFCGKDCMLNTSLF